MLPDRPTIVLPRASGHECGIHRAKTARALQKAPPATGGEAGTGLGWGQSAAMRLRLNAARQRRPVKSAKPAGGNGTTVAPACDACGRKDRPALVSIAFWPCAEKRVISPRSAADASKKFESSTPRYFTRPAPRRIPISEARTLVVPVSFRRGVRTRNGSWLREDGSPCSPLFQARA